MAVSEHFDTVDKAPTLTYTHLIKEWCVYSSEWPVHFSDSSFDLFVQIGLLFTQCVCTLFDPNKTCPILFFGWKNKSAYLSPEPTTDPSIEMVLKRTKTPATTTRKNKKDHDDPNHIILQSDKKAERQ